VKMAPNKEDKKAAKRERIEIERVKNLPTGTQNLVKLSYNIF